LRQGYASFWGLEYIGPNKKFDDNISRVYTIHQRDGQTDGHRTTVTYA